MQTVEQRHRDAAAKFYRYAWHRFWPDDQKRAWADSDDIKAGRCDNWYLVQVIAEFEASLPPSAPVDRDAVARIIDPETWQAHDAVEAGNIEGYSISAVDFDRAVSLSKADAILALHPKTTVPIHGEMREALKWYATQVAKLRAENLRGDPTVDRLSDLEKDGGRRACNALQGDN